MWVRIVVLSVAVVSSLVGGFFLERRIHRRLAGVGGRSVPAALAVGLGFPLAVAAALALWGVLSMWAHANLGLLAGVIGFGLGLALISPFGWCLMPGSPTGPGISDDLREAGATKRGARTIAIAGGAGTFLFAFPAMFYSGIMIVVLGTEV